MVKGLSGAVGIAPLRVYVCGVLVNSVDAFLRTFCRSFTAFRLSYSCPFTFRLVSGDPAIVSEAELFQYLYRTIIVS